MFGNKYDHDEALRITEVTAMYQGNTYKFTVRNTEGKYNVSVIEHIHPGLPPVLCRHVADPAFSTGRELKATIWESIEKHLATAHKLSIIKK